MNLFDWIALALVALLAIAGYFRGLLTAALSLAGIVGGALLGARLAPFFLSGGSTSRYATLFALGGAIFCAIVLEAAGSYLGVEDALIDAARSRCARSTRPAAS